MKVNSVVVGSMAEGRDRLDALERSNQSRRKRVLRKALVVLYDFRRDHSRPTPTRAVAFLNSQILNCSERLLPWDGV